MALNRKRRLTYSQRKARLDRLGMAGIGAVALAFAGMVYGAIQLDSANGITVSESLASAGFGKRPATWRLTVERWDGNAYVIDSGLTADDCGTEAGALAAASATRFADILCEEER